jgi:hypothetical protein
MAGGKLPFTFGIGEFVAKAITKSCITDGGACSIRWKPIWSAVNSKIPTPMYRIALCKV